MKKIVLLLFVFLASCGSNNIKKIEENKNMKNTSINVQKDVKIDNINKENIEKRTKNDNGNYLNFCKNIRSLNFFCYIGDKLDGFLIYKLGNGEKINYGDYIEIKTLENIGTNIDKFVFYIGKDTISDFTYLDGIPIGTIITIDRTKYLIKRKVNFKDYKAYIIKQAEEEFKNNVKDIKDKNEIQKQRKSFEEEYKKTIKELTEIHNNPKNNISVPKEKKITLYKIVIRNEKILKGGDTGIFFDKIVLGGKYKYQDKVCFKQKDEEKTCKELKKGLTYSDIIVVGKLGVGTKFKVYYNGGNGGMPTEIVK